MTLPSPGSLAHRILELLNYERSEALEKMFTTLEELQNDYAEPVSWCPVKGKCSD